MKKFHAMYLVLVVLFVVEVVQCGQSGKEDSAAVQETYDCMKTDNQLRNQVQSSVWSMLGGNLNTHVQKVTSFIAQLSQFSPNSSSSDASEDDDISTKSISPTLMQSFMELSLHKNKNLINIEPTFREQQLMDKSGYQASLQNAKKLEACNTQHRISQILPDIQALAMNNNKVASLLEEPLDDTFEKK